MGFVSCFYMVIATAASNVSDTHPALQLYGLKAAKLAQECYDAAHAALEASRWSVRPQIRAIQAILLKMAYFRPGAPDAGSSFFVWTAVAIRLGQLLHLNRMGNDASIMPPVDPAFPSVPCTLRRQLAIRIWWWTCAQEFMFSSGDGIEAIQLGNSCKRPRHLPSKQFRLIRS